MITNPLRLVWLSISVIRGQKPPTNEAELFDTIIDSLINYWTDKKGQQRGGDDLLAVAGYVAQWMLHSEEQHDLSEDALAEAVWKGVKDLDLAHGRDAVEHAEDIQRRLLDTGLMTESEYDAQDRKRFGFFHPTATEYLSAHLCASQWKQGRIETRTLLNDRSVFKRDEESSARKVLFLLTQELARTNIEDSSAFVSEILDADFAHPGILFRGVVLAYDLVVKSNIAVRLDLRSLILTKFCSSGIDAQYLGAWEYLVNILQEGFMTGMVSQFTGEVADNPLIEDRVARLLLPMPMGMDDPMRAIRKVLVARGLSTALGDWFFQTGRAYKELNQFLGGLAWFKSVDQILRLAIPALIDNAEGKGKISDSPELPAVVVSDPISTYIVHSLLPEDIKRCMESSVPIFGEEDFYANDHETSPTLCFFVVCENNARAEQVAKTQLISTPILSDNIGAGYSEVLGSTSLAWENLLKWLANPEYEDVEFDLWLWLSNRVTDASYSWTNRMMLAQQWLNDWEGFFRGDALQWLRDRVVRFTEANLTDLGVIC